jgi:glycosyltransferase involved in cell wall biosynthesis
VQDLPTVTPALDRVVIFSDISGPCGGAEKMALLSAEVMAETGVPVTFITGDTGENCPLDRAKIEVISLGSAPLTERPFLYAATAGLYSREAFSLVKDFIAQRDTPGTIYHLHNWSKILSPSIFRALRPVSSRLFLSAHDFALVCPNLGYSNFQKSGEACALRPLSAPCMLTNCDRRRYSHKLWRVARSRVLRSVFDFAEARALIGIIHPSLSEPFERGGIPRQRIRVVRNPVEPFTAERVKAEDNQDLFFIGRVVHEKGVDLAAEAARLTGKRLRVIGVGEAQAEIAKRYPEVVFEGFRSHAEIGKMIDEARAVIVSSRLPEAFTLVAHEAMRSGIPVVAFSDVDCQEAAEIGAAIIVPPREAASLASGIEQLEDRDAIQKISLAAFKEGWRFSNTVEEWRGALLQNYAELRSQQQVGEQWNDSGQWGQAL